MLWTDPDVLFRSPVDGCSLPRPRLLSIGAESAPGSVWNCGVMYVCVRICGGPGAGLRRSVGITVPAFAVRSAQVRAGLVKSRLKAAQCGQARRSSW